MKVKINFSDFWPGFTPYDNYFYNTLKSFGFDVEISATPDYLFYSVFGSRHQDFSCKKIFYTGENIAPNMNYCDYAFTFDYLDHPRHYRFPIYLLLEYDKFVSLTKKSVDESFCKRKFCSFLASNSSIGSGAKQRLQFVKEVSKYKKVDCGGKSLNNIGYLVKDKYDFQRQYKFIVCFENGAHRTTMNGYTTEKLVDGMYATSLPIYSGDPLVHLDFNDESFIQVNKFQSFEKVIEKVIELDQNDALYLDMLKKPWLHNNEVPDRFKLENINNFFYNIFK